MLALHRKERERTRIGNDIIVTVIAIKGNRVVIGIDAPKEVLILREEVYQRDLNELPVEVTVTSLVKKES